MAFSTPYFCGKNLFLPPEFTPNRFSRSFFFYFRVTPGIFLRTIICYRSTFLINVQFKGPGAVNSNSITITLVNECDYNAWPAFFGKPLISGGGLGRMDPRTSVNISVPIGWDGGQIWARMGCENGLNTCSSGTCGVFNHCLFNANAFKFSERSQFIFHAYNAKCLNKW